jgi:hypothetical protein
VATSEGVGLDVRMGIYAIEVGFNYTSNYGNFTTNIFRAGNALNQMRVTAYL